MSRKKLDKSVPDEVSTQIEKPIETETPVQTGVSKLDNSFDVGIVKPEYLKPITISLDSTPMRFIVDFGCFLTHDFFIHTQVKLIQLNNENSDLDFVSKKLRTNSEYFVENALIGWENAFSNGEEVLFTKEKAVEYFKSRPGIYSELEIKCLNTHHEISQKKESDIKN